MKERTNAIELARRASEAVEQLPADADMEARRSCWNEIAPLVRQLAGKSALETALRQKLLEGNIEHVRNLLRVAATSRLPRRAPPRWFAIALVALVLGLWGGGILVFRTSIGPDLCSERCNKAGFGTVDNGLYNPGSRSYSYSLLTACHCVDHGTRRGEALPDGCTARGNERICSESIVRFFPLLIAPVAALPILIAVVIGRLRRW